MTPVTKVTKGRILSDEDYREMYAELEGDGTPHTVVRRIGEPPTAAAWYKWRKGDGPLTANMQAKLRAAHGITTVMDACATASETSTVYQVGEGITETIVMIAGSEPMALRVNGTVEAQVYPTPAQSMQSAVDSLRAEYGVSAECPVMAVTTRQERTEPRIRYIRPCATETQDYRRKMVNVSWAEIIDAGLKAYEVIA